MSGHLLTSHPGYEVRALTAAEFRPLWEAHSQLIFDNALRLHLDELLSAEEKQKIADLKSNMGSPLVLRYGLFKDDTFIGWHTGDQKSADEYYMRNSAILPEHRRQGLYSALVQHVMQQVTSLGFQRITSRHTATNNSVIIAKLKLGFVITGLEISDIFGLLVNLTYFTNPDRRRMMDVRSGESKPDAILKQWLGL
jgi:ribosomal protein S18 acetylase RimI-like enzyme